MAYDLRDQSFPFRVRHILIWEISVSWQPSGLKSKWSERSFVPQNHSLNEFPFIESCFGSAMPNAFVLISMMMIIFRLPVTWFGFFRFFCSVLPFAAALIARKIHLALPNKIEFGEKRAGSGDRVSWWPSNDTHLSKRVHFKRPREKGRERAAEMRCWRCKTWQQGKSQQQQQQQVKDKCAGHQLSNAKRKEIASKNI